ncbi:Hypothetical protein FKW44_010935 [Caligus rogercresseyi]|uniref:Uncharacterized protein n=1 Tax=Caligus rogercresseyi TaxID=217165 RepID=A0A7T8HHK4_CALRO|nr:Hypothetical protein FKW44_010935 [Caligus rogercresseyi]
MTPPGDRGLRGGITPHRGTSLKEQAFSPQRGGFKAVAMDTWKSFTPRRGRGARNLIGDFVSPSRGGP